MLSIVIDKRDLLTALDGNRAAVYGAVASIAGSLLGFVITSISIVIGFSQSDRLAVVRESSHYPTLWRILTSTTTILAASTLLALSALVVDRDPGGTFKILTYVLLAALVVAALRIWRTIWVLKSIIGVVTAERARRPGEF
ncbi:MAG: hypothetical protein WDA16_08795 [Candidatus Thermoplasmatota archaeon]